MEKIPNTIKKLLLGTVIALLFLPMVQHLVILKELDPLHGSIEDVPPSDFGYRKWFDGSYAKETDKYLTNNFGFRETSVRLDNQLAYEIFNETRANNVIVGKDEYLYEKNYIDAYTGRDFLGEDVIKEKVRKLKFVQEKMEEEGKVFLTVLAAGKASFYPEYIPDEMMKETDKTNYHVYRKELEEQGVNHIDFNAWFMENKGKLDYPLYPKTGIHWSEYGMTLAADSMLSWITEAKDWDLPEVSWTDVFVSDSLRETDDDIEKGMNLLYKIPNRSMGYLWVQLMDEGKKKPKGIVIADSFFWGMYRTNIPIGFFDDVDFWYYFNVAYRRSMQGEIPIKDLDFGAELSDNEVLILMATEGNLAHFPWSAENRLYEYYNK